MVKVAAEVKLKNRYRHLKRLQEIMNTLTKFGLGQLVASLGLQDRFGWFHNAKEGNPEPVEMPMRIRMAIEELGPAFIKLGQLLSTRSDLIPQPIIDQLQRLQDQVEGVGFEQILVVIEKELGRPWSEVFQELDSQPLASASIGQVHGGRLVSGEEVVIKVQRPGVQRKIKVDLEILLDLAKMVEERTQWGRFYKVTDLVSEFVAAITDEIDYLVEGRNADHIRQNFKNKPEVKVPKIYWEFISSKVLVMENVTGLKVSDKVELRNAGLDAQLIAHRIASSVFTMIFIDGFFHGDPHPGNILITRDHTVVFLDFGLVGRLDEALKDMLGSLAMSIVRKDSQRIADQLIEIGQARSKVDRYVLAKSISKLMHQYYELPLAKLKLGQILQEMLHMAYHYKIKIPAEITLLAKTLVTLEGIVHNLDDQISIIELAEPFAKHLVKERYKPSKVKKRLIREGLDLYSTSLALPKKLNIILDKLEDGELVLGLHHRYFEDYMHQLNSISNRLAFSIVLAALIIGSSVIARTQSSYFLNRLPIAEIGYVVAVIIGFWLIFSILRSRRF